MADSNHVDEAGLAEKQALKYAEDLATVYDSLRKSEKRYRALFEYSPVSLWEGELLELKNHIDGLKAKGIHDFSKYFDENPEEVFNSISMIKILDANRATLKLYEAETKKEVIEVLNRCLREIPAEKAKTALISAAMGRSFEIECNHRTCTDKEITVMIKSTVPPGYEDTWARVYFSVFDLTARVQAEFLKKMFGRYLSEEVMNSLIENPDSVRLGGEKRPVTIMMADLRGFMASTESIEPEQVVRMLNYYFEIMVDIIHKYQGTIIEILGDALLVIFGAPQEMENRAQMAIACAIEMQNAMIGVRERNREENLPEMEMGIALNDSEVIVGNIGSKRRSKYGVVGRGVNLAGRIESYSVGGQILISEGVRQRVGPILRLDDQIEIHPKGTKTPQQVYEVGGIGGEYNLALHKDIAEPMELKRRIPIRYTVLDGKHLSEGEHSGAIVGLSRQMGDVLLKSAPDPLTNLKLNLVNASEGLSRLDFYGKIIRCLEKGSGTCRVRFTSLPPGIDGYFQAAMDQGRIDAGV
jgi:class 3 adenylate cyclase